MSRNRIVCAAVAAVLTVSLPALSVASETDNHDPLRLRTLERRAAVGRALYYSGALASYASITQTLAAFRMEVETIFPVIATTGAAGIVLTQTGVGLSARACKRASRHANGAEPDPRGQWVARQYFLGEMAALGGAILMTAGTPTATMTEDWVIAPFAIGAAACLVLRDICFFRLTATSMRTIEEYRGKDRGAEVSLAPLLAPCTEAPGLTLIVEW